MRTLLIVALLVLPTQGEEPAAARHADLDDGGALALFCLLNLENRHVSFESVQASLPRRNSTTSDRSLRELREAALGLGVPLRGVRLPRGYRGLDGPALTLLRTERGGRYVVIRPVGHTGRLLQVIDLHSEPEVADAAFLTNSRLWTGLALVTQRETARGARIVGLVVGVASGITLAWLVARRLGAFRATQA